MMKRTDPSGVDRRSLLLAAGGTALASGARAETGGGGGLLPSKTAYMKVWAAAETVELWPNGAPGAEAFRRQPEPPGADPAHIFNIERPALHAEANSTAEAAEMRKARREGMRHVPGGWVPGSPARACARFRPGMTNL